MDLERKSTSLVTSMKGNGPWTSSKDKARKPISMVQLMRVLGWQENFMDKEL